MKTILTILSLLIGICSISTSFAYTASDLNRIQKELEKVEKQKNKLESQKADLIEGYEKAMKKIGRNSDDQDSRSYKRSIQKADNIQMEIEEVSYEINKKQLCLDSLQKELQLFSEETTVDFIEVENDDISEFLSEEPVENNTELETEAEEEEQSVLGPDSKEEFSKNEKEQNSNKKNESLSSEGKVVGIVFLLGFIAFLYVVFKPKKCPKCKKGTMKFKKGNDVLNENHEKVFRKVYRCNNCGYEDVEFSEIPQKNK